MKRKIKRFLTLVKKDMRDCFYREDGAFDDGGAVVFALVFRLLFSDGGYGDMAEWITLVCLLFNLSLLPLSVLPLLIGEEKEQGTVPTLCGRGYAGGVSRVQSVDRPGCGAFLQFPDLSDQRGYRTSIALPVLQSAGNFDAFARRRAGGDSGEGQKYGKCLQFLPGLFHDAGADFLFPRQPLADDQENFPLDTSDRGTAAGLSWSDAGNVRSDSGIPGHSGLDCGGVDGFLSGFPKTWFENSIENSFRR